MYRHPLLLGAAYLGLGVAAIMSLSHTAEGIGRAVSVVAFVLFAGLLGGFKSGHHLRHVLAYLAAQTGLISLLFFTLPDATGLLILLNILSVHAALMLPPRLLAGWLALVAILIGLGLVALQGWPSLLLLLGPMAGNVGFAVMGGALRQAEAARRHSQALLAELNVAHRQLQDYAVQAQKLAVAEERNRLARDLHDSAKQQAFALAAQVAAARALLKRDPRAAEARLGEAEHLSDDLRDELSNLILDLRPPGLADQGLEAALAAYAADWSRQSGIPIAVLTPDGPRLSAETEQALFRLAQEALANIARHSGAAHASLELTRAPGCVILAISDDGLGFEAGGPATGVGLQSMRERIDALGGTLSLESAPGHGTRITARIRERVSP